MLTKQSAYFMVAPNPNSCDTNRTPTFSNQPEIPRTTAAFWNERSQRISHTVFSVHVVTRIASHQDLVQFNFQKHFNPSQPGVMSEACQNWKKCHAALDLSFMHEWSVSTIEIHWNNKAILSVPCALYLKTQSTKMSWKVCILSDTPIQQQGETKTHILLIHCPTDLYHVFSEWLQNYSSQITRDKIGLVIS